MELYDFVKAARLEAERYGSDPLIFLRELVQNARDAGASAIDIKCPAEQDSFRFTDNGVGMARAHATQFLFRLYASSKEADAESVGHFGVGFWSVLLADPRVVEIYSNDGKNSWGIRLEPRTGEWEWLPGLNERGTVVKLTGASVPLSDDLVSDALARFCPCPMRRGLLRSRLSISVNGKAQEGDLPQPAGSALRFESSRLRGVVALGPAPRVRVYSRGLWVTEVSDLRELMPSAGASRQMTAVGLAPDIVFDAHDIDLVLSRRAPAENKKLEKVVATVTKQIERLVDEVIDGARRPSVRERIVDGAASVAHALGGPWGVLALATWVVVLAGVMGWILWQPPSATGPLFATKPGFVGSAKQTSSAIPSPSTASYGGLPGYRGPVSDAVSTRPTPLALSYEGVGEFRPGELWFRAVSVIPSGEEHGWELPAWQEGLPRAGRESEGAPQVEVHLEVDATGPVPLPIPSGYHLIAGSVRFDRLRVLAVEKLGHVWLERAGAPLEGLSGALRYRVERGDRDPPRPRVALNLDWPRATRRWLKKVRQLPPQQRIASVYRRARRTHRYDTSSASAAAFAATSGPWQLRALQIKAADCDVKNGLAVLWLNAVGIPARLAVGYVAAHQKAIGGLHAWTEYWHRGQWRRFDVSVGPEDRPSFPSAHLHLGATTDAQIVPKASPAIAGLPGELTAGVPAGDVNSKPAEPSVDYHAAAPQPQEPSIGQSSAEVVSWSTWLLVCCLTALAVALGRWLYGRRLRGRLVQIDSDAGNTHAIAAMLRDAISRPDRWARSVSLWRRRTLPTLRGPWMSLEEAIRRGREGKLWVSDGSSRLASKATDRVLDLRHPVLGPVARSLGGANHLEYAEYILAQAHSSKVPELAVLCRLLRGVHLLPTRLGGSTAVQYIDLRSLYRGAGAWVMLDLEHRDVPLTARDDSARNRFVWVDWLLARLPALSEQAPKLRENAAMAWLVEDGRADSTQVSRT